MTKAKYLLNNPRKITSRADSGEITITILASTAKTINTNAQSGIDVASAGRQHGKTKTHHKT